MASYYYRDANAVILVYDISDLETFKNIEKWLIELDERIKKQNLIIGMAGNKCDLPGNQRQVSVDKAKMFAKENNVIFFETSAKSNTGIRELFSSVAEEIYQQLQIE
eukprot:TRINITY_DN29097_c0_g1_i1.p4 TRINITY_DN29097_c0_g1~~TRINITY_DN29097_c0_g1_i1.p4  ORF type:complete len:107 (+),score=28.93 TRINITY_DN29097_c0_g1_i1:452-772(+)